MSNVTEMTEELMKAHEEVIKTCIDTLCKDFSIRVGDIIQQRQGANKLRFLAPTGHGYEVSLVWDSEGVNIVGEPVFVELDK